MAITVVEAPITDALLEEIRKLTNAILIQTKVNEEIRSLLQDCREQLKELNQ